MNEDMKKTLDHAYEVLEMNKETMREQLTLNEKEAYIKERYNSRLEEIKANKEMSEKEKEEAIKTLGICGRLLIVSVREGTKIDPTKDMTETDLADIKDYTKKYQEKESKNKKELAEKLIRELLNSFGLKIGESFNDKDGNIIKIDPTQWEEERFKEIVKTARLNALEVLAKNKEITAEELVNNIKFLEELVSKNQEERIEMCNKFLEKNKAKKAGPANKTTSNAKAEPANKTNSNGKAEENSKETKFKNWLKKFKTALKTHIDARYPSTWGKRH